MALERGRGRGAIPVRSTIVGIALAAVTISAVVSFGASLDHLTGTPRLYGWGWDVSAGNPYADDLTHLMVPVLQSDRDVAAYSGASFAPISVDGHSVSALAFEHLKGSVGPPAISGRAPAAADEIAIGTRTLRRLRRSVGQTVQVSAGGATRPMRVVGRSVYPAIGPSDAGGVGEGAGLTMAGLRTLVPSAPENLFMIRLGVGADRAAVVARLRPQLQRAQVTVFTAQRPTDVENYRRVNAVPFALAALIGALALVTVTYLVGVSVRRRRRDLAVLKTLGFVRRQVQVAVVWQATVVAALALLVGVPGGVVAGRWAWRLFAQQQGVLPEPVVPVLLLIGIAAAVLAMANLMAAVPARVASRTHPALILRSE
jgi:putative ABC transport system permease protein